MTLTRTAILGLAIWSATSLAFAQTQVYVDASATGPGNGSVSNPYVSLSYAISMHSVNADYNVAGRDASAVYSQTSATPGPYTETYPIVIPPGVRVKHWVPAGATPQVAVFDGSGAGPGGANALAGFEFADDNPGNWTRIRGRYPFSPPTSPVASDQGFEFQNFDVAFKFEHGPNWNDHDYQVIVDGVYVHDCGVAVQARFTDTRASQVQVSNARIRGGYLSEPLVQVELYDPPNIESAVTRFNLVSVDIRPGAADHQASAVAFYGTSDDLPESLLVEVRNTVISGQPDGLPTVPNSALKFHGAGIEFGLKSGHDGAILLDNYEVRDTKGDGLFGVVYGDGTQGTCEIKSSRLHAVAGPLGNTTWLSSTHGMPSGSSESGLHLILSEGANWKTVNANLSKFNDNYRHGIHLEGRSQPDHTDGFHVVDFNACQVAGNGLQVGTNAQAHGFFAELTDAIIRFSGRRTAFVNNHTSGIKYLLGNGGLGVLRGQYLALTNSTVSRNHGIGTTDTFAFPRDVCPITVESHSEEHQLETHLSQVTVTDNPEAGAAFSIFGRFSQQSQDLLWPNGSPSTVDNSILRENGFTGGGPGVQYDLAYYPDGLLPLPVPPDQWLRMMTATSHSNVGSVGSQVLNYPGPGSLCFDMASMLGPLSIAGLNFGDVMIVPGSVNLIDRGDGSPFAGELTDNIGAPRQVDYPPTGSSYSLYDVGAFELQP